MAEEKRLPNTSPCFGIEVSGDYACFTRPEMKAERVSYDVITPSAARAIFEAILWKPAIRWTITRIEVMKPISFMNIKRNEIDHVISAQVVEAAAKKGRGSLGVTPAGKNRMQRFSVILRDVKYRIYGHFQMTEKAGDSDDMTKFISMFNRRLSKGQCFNQPYLGCREFSADFCPIEDVNEAPLQVSQNLGWMLLDLDFSDPNKPKPMLFNANMENGVIEIPPRAQAEVIA